MIVKKFSEAKEYVAPNHRDCSTLAPVRRRGGRLARR